MACHPTRYVVTHLLAARRHRELRQSGRGVQQGDLRIRATHLAAVRHIRAYDDNAGHVRL